MTKTPSKARLLHAMQSIHKLLEEKHAKAFGLDRKESDRALAEFYGGVRFWAVELLGPLSVTDPAPPPPPADLRGHHFGSPEGGGETQS